MINWKHWIAATLILTASMGCQKVEENPTGTVQGKIVLGSAPLSSGQIEFFSSALGTGSVTFVNEDGSYQLSTPLPAGEYSISIQGLIPEPGLPTPPPTKIPKKYWTAKTSGITQSVVKGPNTFDFTLDEK